MAKQRYVNTRFWSDNFISELNPLDRYLFLYFLTNEHTNICGIYEVPLKTISFETGIELDMLKKMLKRLQGKVYYIDGWVYIRNFAKHQAVNDSIVKGIEASKKIIPQEILDKIQGIDSLYPDTTQDPTYLNSNSNSNINSNTKEIVASDKSVFGEFKNVLLKEEEYQKLVSVYGEKNTSILVEQLSAYMASKKKKYASHYATLLNWGRRKVEEYKDKLQTKKRYIA